MKKVIITEEEKNRIRGLYEQTTGSTPGWMYFVDNLDKNKWKIRPTNKGATLSNIIDFTDRKISVGDSSNKDYFTLKISLQGDNIPKLNKSIKSFCDKINNLSVNKTDAVWAEDGSYDWNDLKYADKEKILENLKNIKINLEL